MNKNKLKVFAKNARIKLLSQIRSKLEYVLNLDNSEIRNKEKQVNQLRDELKSTTQDELIEKVAYIWFNRLVALRFMDNNNFHTLNMKILSSIEGYDLPEVLVSAKRGTINDKLQVDREKINDLLDGKIPSKDAQGEVYQMLLVSVCNYYHKVMPFMFEKIEDYTELLLPDNLLTESSIVNDVIDGMSEEDSKNVEIIGWLYQYYISDKKDDVFASLKKNVKITPQNIPAATQLFTPHWIVRYMVENSLGRLWLENKPNSKLKDHMKYYIENPQDNDEANNQSANTLKISSPEEIRLIDPCCGSGHILVYAFELLTKIYEEEGYDQHDIPKLILENNLYGIDIDHRAASLSNFALMMKATQYYNRFIIKLERDIPKGEEFKTNVIAMENDESIAKFKEAKNFGSLIEITQEEYDAIKIDEDTLFAEQQKRIKKQALFLSQKYHCVITNPPYLGGSGMNNLMSEFVKKNYPDSKSDLFSCFIERCETLILQKHYISMIIMHSWMFLSSFEKLRRKIIDNNNIITFIHMPYEGRGRTSLGINFGTSAFIMKKDTNLDYKGDYQCIRFNEIDEDGLPFNFPTINERHSNALSKDFEKIPGSPIAYWVSDTVKDIFVNSKKLGEIAKPRQGMATNDNSKFLRFWPEIPLSKIGFSFNNREEAKESRKKWFPYNKGGDFKKWYGNNEFLINWENDGFEIKRKKELDLKEGRITANNSKCWNQEFYFKEGITWSLISSSCFGVRYSKPGFLFDVGGSCLFVNDNLPYFLSYLCSKITFKNLQTINPTLNFQAGNIASLPIIYPSSESTKKKINEVTQQCIDISQLDWNSRETSWDFINNELIKMRNTNLEISYENYSRYWKEKFYQLHKNEEELNKLFIEIYGLQDELTPDVALKDITILKEESFINENNQLEFKKDRVIKEFISYGVGCMLGRYSLDKEGLVLANQGETIQDYLERIPNPSFMPDEDNVIPILDDEYFKDDIVNQFKTFLKVSFGEENYPENLKFVEDAIGKDIRSYFLKDFYEDHIKRYKKRPIYWQFSSEKGSFNVLIYMHRYKNDTVSIILNDYLREYKTRLESRVEGLKKISLSESVTSSEKKDADKEIIKIDKTLKELIEYEQKLFSVANQRVDIDLDDGVKVNYNKFKDVLYKIKGLDKEE